MNAVKTARMAVPGVVFGSYPQRDTRDNSSGALRWLSPLARWNGYALRRNDKSFVAAVRAMQQAAAAAATPGLRSAQLTQLRAQLARDGLMEATLVEAFAVVAEVCHSELGIALYDTQLTAARIMLDGHLAEMATGEGKTLAAAACAAVAALAGVPVHVITANDYLVRRDSAALRAFYSALSLSVGTVTQTDSAGARAAAYGCDITYTTAKELVFDYLRDSVAAPRRSDLEQRAAAVSGAQAPRQLLRGLCMAIVDEADSILIDEARVPLVLSQSAPEETFSDQREAWRLCGLLLAEMHFQVDDGARTVQVTAAGRELLRALAAAADFKWLNARHCEDSVTMALTARHALQRGRDYVVDGGRVHIVDPTTGRKAEGRAWSRGLHQCVEIKEGCQPSAPLATLAQITYQRFFPRYFRLCGMSGTLAESHVELARTYDLQVVKVPLREADRRKVLPPRVFADDVTQQAAVAQRVQALHQAGRPVLIGTDSVRDSEAVSRQITALGLEHAVLNAVQDQREAGIIAAAGAPGAITVATNMAGRGTDIQLAAASRDAGGLHVICCQQNASRRIDRQLLGRCARQGDPGSAEYFIALNGPLLVRNPAAKVLNSMVKSVIKNRFKNRQLPYNTLEEIVFRLLRGAQRAAERRHARERAALMREDQHRGDWLAFSGPEQ